MKHKFFYETSSTVAASKLYVIAVNVSTTSIATQTDLTWSNADDKSRKISDSKKTKKQAANFS